MSIDVAQTQVSEADDSCKIGEHFIARRPDFDQPRAGSLAYLWPY